MSSRRRQRQPAILISPSPTWRLPNPLAAPHHQIHSKPTTTSLSLVFAQPEQGAPLRSAVDQLPSVVQAGADDLESILTTSEMERKRERLQSVSSSASSKRSKVGVESGDTAASQAGEADVAPVNHAMAVVDLTNDDTSPPPPAARDGEDTIMSEPSKPCPTSNETVETTSAPPIPSQAVAPASPVVTSASATAGRSTGWFTSLSRTKLVKSPDVPPAPQPTIPDDKPAPAPLTAVHEAPASSESPAQQIASSPSLRITVPQQSHTPASSPPRSSPPRPRTAPSVSSADEEAPKPRAAVANGDASSSVVVQGLMGGGTGRKSSVSSLNAPSSSSRFMLRIPLLGRPKMPLDQVVAAKEGEEKASPACRDEVSSGDLKADDGSPVVSSSASTDPKKVDSTDSKKVDSPATSASEGVTTPQPPVEAPINKNDIAATSVAPIPSSEPVAAEASGESHERASADTPQGQTTDAKEHAASSSWWGYLGWSSAAVVAEAPEAAAKSVEQHEEAPIAEQVPPPDQNAAPSIPQTSVSAAPSQTTHSNPAPPPPVERQPEDAQPGPISPVKDERTPSLLSAQTGKSQNSAWYAPWSWYNPPSAVPSAAAETPTTPAPDTESSSVTNTGASSATKTESELVKEEALRREEPSGEATNGAKAPSPDKQQPDPAAADIVNPIQSSISANRSGWASFFMSKALLVKTITDQDRERDENGMEVMNVDDDDDHAPGPGTGDRAPSPAPAIPRDIIVPPSKQPPPSPIASSPKSPVLPRQREAKKAGPSIAPLTNSDSIKQDTVDAWGARSTSPASSTKKSGNASPVHRPQAPNLVLPTWSDTFHAAPRSNLPPSPPTSKSKLSKTFSFVSGLLHTRDDPVHSSVKGKERQRERERQMEFLHYGRELPKALEIMGRNMDPRLLSGKCRAVVIGVAGWSPGAFTRTFAGGLPSSSSKFVDMTYTALEKFEEEYNIKFKKVTKIPLEGDGTIERKVSKVYNHLLGNADWMEDLHAADVIFVATHSQGTIVSIHLLCKLITDGHIMTSRNVDILNNAAASVTPDGKIPASATRTQKICCLALCGIHLGPLRYLKTSSILQLHIQYFENAAARELFDFQDTESQLSKDYVKALRTVMDHGAKMVCVASLNDQVVPIYSGLFTAASHPRILRALYIDGDAYHSSDFLSNLLVLLIRIMNAGLSDSGLLAHLSEATAGTLSGVGHSSAYEELATFSLAVNYMFLTSDGDDAQAELVVEPFNAVNEQNDYEIPWSLRDLIADERVAHFFAHEFKQLRDAFHDWSPKTSILRDVKRKLQPIQRLSIQAVSPSKL